MRGTSVAIPVLTDPTYGLPLVVAGAAAMAVTAWVLQRRFLPPPLTPYATRRAWMQRPDTAAYVGASQGRYLPTVELLGRRLAQVLYDRYQLRIDDPRGLRRHPELPSLPTVGTVSALVDELFRAFRAADLAEGLNLGNSWAWLRHHRQLQAARAVARVAADVQAALPLLEAA
jgi:hypothetical protein